MPRYRKKPVVIDAVRWNRHGDHPAVERYEKRSDVDARYDDIRCGSCRCSDQAHGWVPTLEGGHIVCPGDWVITGVKGEHYACKPDIFAETYEPANSASVTDGAPAPGPSWGKMGDET